MLLLVYYIDCKGSTRGTQLTKKIKKINGKYFFYITRQA